MKRCRRAVSGMRGEDYQWNPNPSTRNFRTPLADAHDALCERLFLTQSRQDAKLRKEAEG